MEAIKEMIKRRQEWHDAYCCSVLPGKPRCDNFVILSALELLLDYALVLSGYRGEV